MVAIAKNVRLLRYSSPMQRRAHLLRRHGQAQKVALASRRQNGGPIGASKLPRGDGSTSRLSRFRRPGKRGRRERTLPARNREVPETGSQPQTMSDRTPRAPRHADVTTSKDGRRPRPNANRRKCGSHSHRVPPRCEQSSLRTSIVCS
jgi:hypothetical protein